MKTINDISGPRVGTFSFLDGKDDKFIDLDTLDELSRNRELQGEAGEILERLRSYLTLHGELPFNWTPQEANYLRTQGKERWLEYLIYRFKFVCYPAEGTVSDFPVYLLIEPISVCNLRCVMCYQIDPSFTRKPFMGMMDLDLFRNIIDQAADGGTGGITLASRGEPTLHPQLPEMLDYMRGKFFEVKLTTNATRLSEELCHRILESEINQLVFSVDAHTKDVYEQIRVRGKFEQVQANIARFHDIRAKHYPKSPVSTRISAVRFREDQDPQGFKDFWSDIVDEVGMKDAQLRWNTYENDIDTDVTSRCWFPWERLYIWHDGTTNPCDPDYKSHLSPGNVRDSSIRDIWHGAALTRLREAHDQGRRGEFNPCDRCGVCFT
jgi:MoaA/NifB/PqqE/SkfB family radical SAM enzyme